MMFCINMIEVRSTRIGFTPDVGERAVSVVNYFLAQRLDGD